MAKTIEARFWEKVDKQADHWLWTASRNVHGYGQFNILGQMVPAHRYAYESVKDEIPSTLQLDHTCEIKHCVNPDHLQPTTSKQNIRASYTRKNPDWKPGKKYLLYIHVDRFDEEKEKSKLVNDLLKQHYSDDVYTPSSHVYTSLPKDNLRNISVKPNGVLAPINPDEPSVIVTNDWGA